MLIWWHIFKKAKNICKQRFNIYQLLISGRMALLVTLFLVLVNIFNSVTGNAPKAEGLTAVETWVSQCSFSSSAMMSWRRDENSQTKTTMSFVINWSPFINIWRLINDYFNFRWFPASFMYLESSWSMPSSSKWFRFL